MTDQPAMSREDFIAFVRDHLEKPRNHGEMPDADAEYTYGNPGCGDIVTVYLKVGADDTVREISFTGDGCTISQAGASFITTRLKDKPVSEIAAMEYDLIFTTFGKDVMATRPRCATLGLNAAKSAAKVYTDGRRLAAIQSS